MRARMSCASENVDKPKVKKTKTDGGNVSLLAMYEEILQENYDVTKEMTQSRTEGQVIKLIVYVSLFVSKNRPKCNSLIFSLFIVYFKINVYLSKPQFLDQRAPWNTGEATNPSSQTLLHLQGNTCQPLAPA